MGGGGADAGLLPLKVDQGQSVRWLSFHVVTVAEDAGGPARRFHLVEDVTERRRLERMGERLLSLAGGNLEDAQTLTPREREVGRLLLKGLTGRRIAERLNIKYPTQRNHVQHILDKLDAPNRTGALVKVLLAILLAEEG